MYVIVAAAVLVFGLWRSRWTAAGRKMLSRLTGDDGRTFWRQRHRDWAAVATLSHAAPRF